MARIESQIEKFARTQLGINLLPGQVEMIKAVSEGKRVIGGRVAGKATARRVMQEWLKQGLVPSVPATVTVNLTARSVVGALSPVGRYCAICYGLCTNQGGWKCPEHGYNSVLMTSREAVKLRAEKRMAS